MNIFGLREKLKISTYNSHLFTLDTPHPSTIPLPTEIEKQIKENSKVTVSRITT